MPPKQNAAAAYRLVAADELGLLKGKRPYAPLVAPKRPWHCVLLRCRPLPPPLPAAGGACTAPTRLWAYTTTPTHAQLLRCLPAPNGTRRQW